VAKEDSSVNVPPALSAGVNASILRLVSNCRFRGLDSRGTHLPFVDIVSVPRFFPLVRGRHLEFCGGVEKLGVRFKKVWKNFQIGSTAIHF